MTEPTELKTERLLLRPFRVEDLDDVYAYAKNPEWARYLPPNVPQPYSRRDAEEFVARAIVASWEIHPLWAITLARTAIGGINLSIDTQHETGVLGYSIGIAYWGMGLMPEAARAVMDWGFTERSFAKVYAWADARNKRSHRVTEKLGMTREGVLRSHRKGRNEPIDEVYYGILREEWERARML